MWSTTQSMMAVVDVTEIVLSKSCGYDLVLLSHLPWRSSRRRIPGLGSGGLEEIAERVVGVGRFEPHSPVVMTVVLQYPTDVLAERAGCYR
jgi:hypothetical protein